MTRLEHFYHLLIVLFLLLLFVFILQNGNDIKDSINKANGNIDIIADQLEIDIIDVNKE